MKAPEFPAAGKLEAARRQLETAALLYFNDRDPISIHTLVAAAYQILEDLASKRGQKMLIEHSMVIGLGDELAKEVRMYMRKPQNYFKHADQSDEPEIEYSPGLSELMLLDAYGKLMQLTGEHPPLLHAFESWYFMHHPEMLKPLPAQQALMIKAKKAFGSLSRLEFLQGFLSNTVGLRS